MRSIFLTLLILIFGCASMQMSFTVQSKEKVKLNDPGMVIETSKWSATSKKGSTGTDKCLKYKGDDCIEYSQTAGGNSETRTQEVLKKIMTKLMIGISLITVLLIVIGGGCLIFSGGSDGLKTKGKNILIAGMLSLSVAMCSAIIINVVGYILYK